MGEAAIIHRNTSPHKADSGRKTRKIRMGDLDFRGKRLSVRGTRFPSPSQPQATNQLANSASGSENPTDCGTTFRAIVE
jgi:hypothetical protein